MGLQNIRTWRIFVEYDYSPDWFLCKNWWASSSHSVHSNSCRLNKTYLSGWAYDLKTVPEDLIRKRAARTGDGSTQYTKCIVAANETAFDENNNVEVYDKLKFSPAPQNGLDEENLIWGWDDTDMSEQDKSGALIINKIGKRD